MTFSVIARGTAPLGYRLLVNETLHETAKGGGGVGGGGEGEREGGEARLSMNITSLAKGLSIITVVAFNTDRSGQEHSAAISSVVITSPLGKYYACIYVICSL